MKVTLTPTTHFTEVNGTNCRIWEGTTDKDVKLRALIAMVQIADPSAEADFARELIEIQPVILDWPVPRRLRG